MDVQSSNMLRAAARRCRDDIRAEWQKAGLRNGRDYGEKDRISQRVIRKHAAALKPKFTLLQLLWQIGIIENTLSEKD